MKIIGAFEMFWAGAYAKKVFFPHSEDPSPNIEWGLNGQRTFFIHMAQGSY